MWRVYASRAVNYYLFAGDPDEMFSSRVHRECWKRTELVIDRLFFWQLRHCRRSYLWEKFHATTQDATGAPQEEAPDAASDPDVLA